MQVTVSRVSPVEVSLRVALPPERVTSALERAYDKLGKEAQIRGFRRGKVPRPLLRQYFGERVASDVFRKLVDETLPGALRDQKLDPVTTPSVQSNADLLAAADWSYTARLEIRPEITELNLSTLTLTRKVYTVDDHDVQHVLDAKRNEAATLRTPDPMRPAVKSDAATVDMDLTVDGVVRPEFGMRGRTVEVGAELMPEIDAALPGMSPGESRAITVHFPEGSRQADLAGRAVDIKITLHTLQEKILPEIDDEFARDVGKDSLADLTASIRADLEKRYRDRAEEDLRDEAIDALVKANPIAVPPSMVESALGQLRQELTRGLAMRGQSLPSGIDAGLRPQAEARVRAGLLLNELARVNNIQITDEDLNARLEAIARETGRAVQKLRVEYRDARRRDMLASQCLELKMMDLLLSKATITETSVPTHRHDDHGHEATDAPADGSAKTE